MNQTAQVCSVLTSIPEKFVVDFANGIDVAQDHIRVQKNRSDFFNRLSDNFNGNSLRRQNEINSNVLNGLESSLKWLTELTESHAKSNFAIARINDRLFHLNTDLSKIAHFSADTKQQLNLLQQNVAEKFQQLNMRINTLELRQEANHRKEVIFNHWEQGRYESFSLAGQVYAVLEELNWSAYGDFIRTLNTNDKKDHLELLLKKIKTYFIQSRIEWNQSFDKENWFQISNIDLNNSNENFLGLAYLGDC